MKNANKNEGDEIMNNMKQKSKNENMIQLTMSNAVDQTKKIRIEVPAGTSIAQAAKDSGIAPKGAFDVFTPGGEAVTQMSVDRHRDAVLYIGPQKVAGGANDEFILDPEPGDEIEDGPQMGPKFICFTSAYDPTVRHDVVPQDDQTVKQAAQMAGMGPRDQSAWSVFDADGTTVDNQPASELTGEVLYVGPTAIDAGAKSWSSLGLDHSEFIQIKIGYPSIISIKNHKLSSGNVGIVQLRMRGKKSHRSKEMIYYKLVIDFRDFPTRTPYAYVQSPADSEIKHCNIFHEKKFSFAPRLSLSQICIGSYDDKFQNLPKDRIVRLNCFLNQLQHVLSNPNNYDSARSV